MNHDQWIRITACANIPAREGRPVRVAGRDIAVFNLGDRFAAVDNRCPHEGGPLCDGIVTGGAVVCPLHGWKIRLDSGIVERPGATDVRVVTYPVRVQDGILTLGLPSADAARPGEAA